MAGWHSSSMLPRVAGQACRTYVTPRHGFANTASTAPCAKSSAAQGFAAISSIRHGRLCNDSSSSSSSIGNANEPACKAEAPATDGCTCAGAVARVDAACTRRWRAAAPDPALQPCTGGATRSNRASPARGKSRRCAPGSRTMGPGPGRQ